MTIGDRVKSTLDGVEIDCVPVIAVSVELFVAASHEGWLVGSRVECERVTCASAAPKIVSILESDPRVILRAVDNALERWEEIPTDSRYLVSALIIAAMRSKSDYWARLATNWFAFAVATPDLIACLLMVTESPWPSQLVKHAAFRALNTMAP